MVASEEIRRTPSLPDDLKRRRLVGTQQTRNFHLRPQSTPCRNERAKWLGDRNEAIGTCLFSKLDPNGFIGGFELLAIALP
jgi:hypothetical protein